MNWGKLSELFPLASVEIKKLHAKSGLEERFLIDEYISSKGKPLTLLFIPILKEIENELRKNNTNVYPRRDSEG